MRRFLVRVLCWISMAAAALTIFTTLAKPRPLFEVTFYVAGSTTLIYLCGRALWEEQ